MWTLTHAGSTHPVHKPRESHRCRKKASCARLQGIVAIMRVEEAGGLVDAGGWQRSESSWKVDCQEFALEGERPFDDPHRHTSSIDSSYLGFCIPGTR